MAQVREGRAALSTQPAMASLPACSRSSRGSSSYPASRNRNPSPTLASSLMLAVSARPSPFGPIRMPAKIRTTTWGMRGPGSAATMMGASAATSATTSSVSRPFASIPGAPSALMASARGPAATVACQPAPPARTRQARTVAVPVGSVEDHGRQLSSPRPQSSWLGGTDLALWPLQEIKHAGGESKSAAICRRQRPAPRPPRVRSSRWALLLITRRVLPLRAPGAGALERFGCPAAPVFGHSL